MKKFLAFVCMITCVFGLTACSSEEKLTEFEQEKVNYAEQRASQMVVPLFSGFMDDSAAAAYDENTAEEVEYIFANDYQMNVDGNAVLAGVESFHNAADTVGALTGMGEITSTIDGDRIIVNVDVTGEKKAAQAEIIFSNDMFMVLESASLHPVSTMGESMGKAAMNTLIGMCTVFAVLILISLIIYCFKFISRIQAKFSKKSKEEETRTEAIDNAVAQIVEQEESLDESDDLELAAVIAAAIAAYEGNASAEGYVVRSIRRVGRSRR